MSWHSPVREALGLEPYQSVSPKLLERLCATAAATFSYERAAQVCAVWGSPVADDSTIHRQVQKAGTRSLEAEKERLRADDVPALREAAVKDAKERLAKECPRGFSLLLMMDGFMTRERGPDWGLKPADALADRVNWREMKTAIIMRTDQRARTAGGRALVLEKAVVAHQGEWDALAGKVMAEARRLGIEHAREVFVVADGGLWIWNLVEERLCHSTQVLDFYHASQHLWALAHELFGDDEAAAKKWAEKLLHQLRHGREKKALSTIADLEGLLAGLGGEAEKKIKNEQNYFAHHGKAGRLAYATVEKRNCPVGSGAMESTCAQLQGRLKRTGQFWTGEGKNRLLSLELSQRNGYWQQLWHYQYQQT